MVDNALCDDLLAVDLIANGICIKCQEKTAPVSKYFCFHCIRALEESSCVYCTGAEPSEKLIRCRFDNLFDEHLSDFFEKHEEVCGNYDITLPGSGSGRPRIDYVLTPKQRLIDIGSFEGPIGVECKKPTTKIGRPIAQCIDYRFASFSLKETSRFLKDHSTSFNLDAVFIFRAEPLGGSLAAISCQFRVGTCREMPSGGFGFYLASQKVLVLNKNTVSYIYSSPNTMGRKRGSR